ncbi:phage GP46 family protein [Luteibacter yeojuensis]|uniref:Phage gp46-like protein n=1 Tax=Luteibacter yeojuensis TaxID=345309 RepID=A0A7X5QU34_9GAMM|nr:phage GP46 family protein [Luteibacter yeojuensis]NID15374.1 hypothetical protein [Luteibacter yeojuensis]
MADITTVWDISRGEGGWVLVGPSLASGNDLATAVLISLFTDRTAEPSDVLPDGTTDRRGWWGDLDEDVPIGSRLWLLERSKLVPAVASAAKGYAEEALAWLVSDDVAAKVSATATISRPSTLRLVATIQHADGTKTAFTFDWAWAQIGA